MTTDEHETDPNGTDESERSDRQDQPPTDPVVEGADGRSPDEMTLEELREEIEALDREIVELIARRTYVADTIAAVKRKQGLPTVDEEQEQAVMDRAGANAEQFDVDSNLVKAIFRLLIELNKIEQRQVVESDRQRGQTESDENSGN